MGAVGAAPPRTLIALSEKVSEARGFLSRARARDIHSFNNSFHSFFLLSGMGKSAMSLVVARV